MFSRLSPVYKGILLALAGYSAFSCADTGVKYLSYHYSIYQLLTIENAFACTILLCCSPLLGGRRGLFRKENLKIHGLRTILNLFVSVLVTYSFRHLPMATAYTLFFTIPFFAVIWGILIYAEKLRGNRMLTMVVGFAGVLMATRPGTESFDIHMLAPLAAAGFISIMFLCGKSLHKPTLFMLAFSPLAGVGLMCLPLAIADFTMPSLHHLVIFAITGACSATGFVMVSMAFRTADSAAITPMMYIQMLWGVIFGFMIFGDIPDPLVLAGAATIIASGAYLIISEKDTDTHV